MATRFTDCEVRDDWFLEQDVNAWSSLSYAVAAVVLLAWVVRMQLPRAFGLLSGMLLLEAAGSVLYHGGRGDVAQLLHDVPIVGMLGFVAGWHAGRLVDTGERGAAIGTFVGVAVATALWAVEPDAVTVVAAAAVLVVVCAELLARRGTGSGVWTSTLVALTVVSGAIWLAGTPDSPVCSPQSWFQPHALWHVLSAVVIVAWSARAATSHPLHPHTD